jgi:7-cyano-7-deazaguanine synthase
MGARMRETSHTAGLLFSGGQDSATCLAWALERYDRVETIGFDYGQRHDIEMQCRLEVREAVCAAFPQWAERLGEDHVIDLSGLGQISETSLTRDVEIEVGTSGLPTTFVPGRNLIFLNFAAALGWRRGFSTLVAGMCEADFSGYPDCRKETLDAQMKAISLGLDREYVLETPLMHLSKAGAWSLAHDLGGEALVEIIRTKTHTCYKGIHDKLHAWGFGCGSCPACEIRARGWSEYVANS